MRLFSFIVVCILLFANIGSAHFRRLHRTMPNAVVLPPNMGCLRDASTLSTAQSWGSLSGMVIDSKTRKPIPNVVVFLEPPKGVHFPISEQDKRRPDLVVQLPQGGAFDFSILLHYPHFVVNNLEAPTGQRLILLGDSHQDHAFTLVSKGANTSAIVGAREKVTLNLRPSRLPTIMESSTYPELKAKIYVFDHPYHTLSDKDGRFHMPRVPTGSTITLMAWREDVGWLLTRSGRPLTLQPGQNVVDIEATE